MMILCCKVASSHGKCALGLLADGVFLSPRTHVSETPAVPNKPASSPCWLAHSSRAVPAFSCPHPLRTCADMGGLSTQMPVSFTVRIPLGLCTVHLLKEDVGNEYLCFSFHFCPAFRVISLGNRSSCSLLVWPGARAQWPVWHTQHRSACRDSPLDKQTSVDLQMPVEVKPDILGSSSTVTHSPVLACSSLLITNRVMAERKVMWAVPARRDAWHRWGFPVFWVARCPSFPAGESTECKAVVAAVPWYFAQWLHAGSQICCEHLPPHCSRDIYRGSHGCAVDTTAESPALRLTVVGAH